MSVTYIDYCARYVYIKYGITLNLENNNKRDMSQKDFLIA